MVTDSKNIVSGQAALAQQKQRQQSILGAIKARLPSMEVPKIEAPVRAPSPDTPPSTPSPMAVPHPQASPPPSSDPFPPIMGGGMGGGGDPHLQPSHTPPPSLQGGSIQDLISQKAQSYGVDPKLALGIAHIESSFNPKAQAKGSSAGGLYQMIDSTWDKYGKGADKYDPSANADAAMRLIKDNQALLQRSGIEPTPQATYLAHFLGAGGAIKVLSHPHEPASNYLTSEAVKVNNLQGKTGSELLNWAGERLNYTPSSVATLGSTKHAL